MKKMLYLLISVLFIYGCGENKSNGDPASIDKNVKDYYTDISSDGLMKTVKFLASPELSGRLAGSEGYMKAANHATGVYKEAELKPINDEGYFQEFSIEYNEITGTPKLALVDGANLLKAYEVGSDFVCRGFTGSGDFTADLVFAGYGISRPDLGYDDYKRLNVDNKIVVVFKYDPRWKPEEGEWGENYPRSKATTASRFGAKGILFVSLPNDEEPQKPIASVLAGEGRQNTEFPQLHVSLDVAKDLFKKSGKTLKELQTAIDSLKQPQSMPLKTTVHVSVNANYEEKHPTVNVVGIYEGKDPVLKNEYVVLGAHLDHVGRQGPVYYPGANDNASGSAAVMHIAETFGRNKVNTDRSIIFVLFSSEESGLYGAKHFTENPPVPLEQIVAMVNVDCIGAGDGLRIGGATTAPGMFEKVKENDSLYVKQGIDETWGGGGADAQPFYDKGIPTLYFVTRNSYTYLHQTGDTPETLNPGLFRNTARLVYLTMVDLAGSSYEKESITEKKEE